MSISLTNEFLYSITFRNWSDTVRESGKRFNIAIFMTEKQELSLQRRNNERYGVLNYSVPIVCSTVCSGAVQRKQQSFVSLALVRGAYRRTMDSPDKGPATRKMFPFNDFIMVNLSSKICLVVEPCTCMDSYRIVTWSMNGHPIEFCSKYHTSTICLHMENGSSQPARF